MKWKDAVRLFALAGFLAGAQPWSAVHAAQVPARPEEIQFRVLKNGLRVVVKEEETADAVSIQLWIRGGTRLEPPPLNGITHLLEHMVFKGTTKRSGEDVKREVEDLGGEFNAETTKDSIRFVVLIAKESFDQAFDALTDTVLHPTLPADELSPEKRVIAMELARLHSDPLFTLREAIANRAYPQYPYRMPVGGTRETLAGIDRSQLVDYHHSRFCPRNMSLVVVGGVSAKHVFDLVDQVFGKLGPGPKPPKEPPFDRGVDRVVRVPHTGPFGRNALMMAFRAPAISDPEDVYAMDVLLTALGDGKGALLERRLRSGNPPLAIATEAGFLTQKGPGLLTITAIGEENLMGTIEATILGIIRDLRDKPLSGDDLRRAKAQLEGSYVADNETVAGKASTMGFYEAIATYEFALTYIDKIRAVTAADVQRVARKYLTPDRYVVGTLSPGRNVARVPTRLGLFLPRVSLRPRVTVQP